MNQRTLTIAVALLLAVTWAGLGLLLVAAYRPPSPANMLVAASPFLPGLLAASAAVWRRRPTAGRAAALELAVGFTALLLSVGFVLSVSEPLIRRGPAAAADTPWLPSAAQAYGGLLALGATALHWALGRRPGRPGLLLAAIVTGSVALIAAAALVLNQPMLAVAACGPVSTADSARVALTARAYVDETLRGATVLTGERSGDDESWSAFLGAGAGGHPHASYVRAGERAWLRSGGQDWIPAPAVSAGERPPPTLDGRPAGLISSIPAAQMEDLGVDALSGQATRHCRAMTDGPAALEAFVTLGWLVGQSGLQPRPALEVWRGELDWWTDATGELVRSSVRVSGHTADAWTERGLRGMLVADMTISEQGLPRHIEEPLP